MRPADFAFRRLSIQCLSLRSLGRVALAQGRAGAAVQQ